MVLVCAMGQRLCSGKADFAEYVGFRFKDVLFAQRPVTVMHLRNGPEVIYWANTVG